MSDEVKKWYGTWPARCNRCNRNLSDMSVFYDANTPQGWGLFCHSCWLIVSYLKLGTGLGQKYDSKTLVKIGG